MNRLSQLIAEYNERRGADEEPMTQRRLAGIVELHEVTVSRHVTGTTSIELSQAVAYAKALGVDVSELWSDAA